MDFLIEPNVAFLILLAGILLGFLAIITPGTGLLEIGALFCVLLSGYAVYNLSIMGWLRGINLFLAIPATGLVIGFLWLVVQKSFEASHMRPTHDLDALLGKIGEAKTAIHEDGSVHVDGELWSARSEYFIPAGSQVGVLRRDGFVIVVEKVDK